MSERKKRDHNSCRGIVCLCCGTKNLKCTKVSPTLEEVVKKHVYSIYSSAVPNYPTGVCPSCRTHLFKAKNGGITSVPSKIRDSWNLDLDLFRPPTRRDPCECRVCCIARFKETNLEDGTPADVPRQEMDQVAEKDETEEASPSSAADGTVN